MARSLLSSGMDCERRAGKPRSTVACLRCRERKVRCDHSLHRQSCTNCVLDGYECVVIDPCRVSSHRSQRKNSAQGPTMLENPVLQRYYVGSGKTGIRCMLQGTSRGCYGDFPSKEVNFEVSTFLTRQTKLKAIAASTLTSIHLLVFK